MSEDLEAAARIGGCALLTVELDRREGEETPRVTVRRVQPFESLATNARLVLEVATADVAAVEQVAAIVGAARGGRGELRLRALLAEGGEADLLLGRDFLLDAELAARIERVPGVTARLRAADPVRLALVA